MLEHRPPIARSPFERLNCIAGPPLPQKYSLPRRAMKKCDQLIRCFAYPDRLVTYSIVELFSKEIDQTTSWRLVVEKSICA
jgi:hypothetical protein